MQPAGREPERRVEQARSLRRNRDADPSIRSTGQETTNTNPAWPRGGKWRYHRRSPCLAERASARCARGFPRRRRAVAQRGWLASVPPPSERCGRRRPGACGAMPADERKRVSARAGRRASHSPGAQRVPAGLPPSRSAGFGSPAVRTTQVIGSDRREYLGGTKRGLSAIRLGGRGSRAYSSARALVRAAPVSPTAPEVASACASADAGRSGSSNVQ